VSLEWAPDWSIGMFLPIHLPFIRLDECPLCDETFFLSAFSPAFFFHSPNFAQKARLKVLNSKFKFFLGVSNRQKSKGPGGGGIARFPFLLPVHVPFISLDECPRCDETFSLSHFLVTPFF
jgi:hypothetical protein